MSGDRTKREIAILGGGPGGIAAAFALTRDEKVRDSIRVTVYQPGWRLGGKCASGFDQRIEEHGLHVWAGFYDNAFQQLQECYGELGREWEPVFERVEDFVLREFHNGKWKAWPTHLPATKHIQPGRNRRPPTLWDLVKWLGERIQSTVSEDERFASLKVDDAQSIYAAAQSLNATASLSPAGRPGPADPGGLALPIDGADDDGQAVAPFDSPVANPLDKLFGKWPKVSSGTGFDPDIAMPGGGAEGDGLGFDSPIASPGDGPFGPRPTPPILGPPARIPPGWPTSPGWPQPRRNLGVLPSIDNAAVARTLVQGISALSGDPAQHSGEQHNAIATLARKLKESFDGYVTDAFGGWADAIRRAWLGFEVAEAILSGIFADNLLARGLSAVDDQELRDWLRDHGASERSLEAAFVTAGYDWSFAYDGDQPSIAAGVGLQGFLRLACDYRGGAFWKSKGSLGDLVYAPMHEVLARRGVRFRYFHRATLLELDAAGTRIARIQFAEQARTTGGGEYLPLKPHPLEAGASVWPPEPDFAQLESGVDLQAAMQHPGFDLEGGADSDDWPGRRTVAIVHRDAARDGDGIFDDVILALPPEAQKQGPCEQLMREHEPWRDMLGGLRSARTIAMQLWFLPNMLEIGHEGPGQLTTACAWPFSTWADMSHLCDVEPHGQHCGSIVYLCGNAPSAMPSVPAAATQFAKVEAEAWLVRHGAVMWPRLGPAGGGSFDFSKLYDPNGGAGNNRLKAQYVRANVRPSDLYVLSVPGTTKLRMSAGGSGIANLFLAGDWVRTDLSAGCVEAAVTAGEEAAQALLARPFP